MTDLQLKPMILGIVTIAAAAVVLFIQQVLIGSHDASLLLNLTFWIALIQGSVAMAAAADISQGKWITPIKKDLLAFYHLMLPVAVLFLALGFQMKIFPWTEKHHLWLNTPFFLGRNFGMLLLSWLVAHLYARAAVQERESKTPGH